VLASVALILTWTELRDQIQAGKTTIIIPIGGTEQSGPGIAVGKHNVRVTVLSQRIAEGLGNALVAPTIAYVPEGGYAPPTSHMRFPGTITIPDERVRTDAGIRGQQLCGARFPEHRLPGRPWRLSEGSPAGRGPSQQDLGRFNARAFVPPEYYEASSDGYAQILRQHGIRDDEIGTHAGLADTSLQLAVAPQMVRLDRLRNGPKLGPADGVYGGDPRRSSAELGQLGVNAIVSRTVDALRKDTAGR
jgi:creatinine amidohydrolase